jgi:hypothetical protein
LPSFPFTGVSLLGHLPPVAAKALSHSVSVLGTAVRTLTDTIRSREEQQQQHKGAGGAKAAEGCALAQPRSENRTRDGLLEAVDDGPLHAFEGYPRAADLCRALQGIDWDAAVAKTGKASKPSLHLPPVDAFEKFLKGKAKCLLPLCRPLLQPKK